MEDLNYEYEVTDSFDTSLEDEIYNLNEEIENQEEVDLSAFQGMGYDDVEFEQLNNIKETVLEQPPKIDLSSMHTTTYNNPSNGSDLHILSQDIGNTEFSIEHYDSVELKYIKTVFNNFIQKLPYFNHEEWKDIAEELDANKSLGKSLPVKIYKIAAVKFLINYAKKHDLLLSKEGESIRVYNGTFWSEVDAMLVKSFISMACVKFGIPKWQAQDSKFTKDLYLQLVGNEFFKKMNYPDETLINLQNGTLKISLNGVTLEPFNPYNYMTYQLGFSYDPQAVNIEWINFINDVLPDKDTQRTLQQSLGYLFIPGLKLEKMLFLYGTGRNGKSVIHEVLTGMLGDSLITHYSLELLTNPKSYQRANIANKLINYCPDIKFDKIDPAEFKILASGEKAQVRQIYQEPYTMTRYAKFISNINTIDNANVESTIGFFRRMIFIPFEITIPEDKQDKFLHHRILENKAGVLNWMLEGAKQVLQNQEIFMSQRCYDFLDNFVKESNLAIRFVEDANLISSTCEDVIDFQTMYDRFVDFCKRQGEKPMKQRLFNKELKKLHIPFDRKNYGYVWFAKFLK